MLRGNSHHKWFLGCWWGCPSPPLPSSPPLLFWLLGREQAWRLDWWSQGSALGHSCQEEKERALGGLFVKCKAKALLMRSPLPLRVLLSQTWVHLPTCSKANALTPDCGEGKYSIYCKAPRKENGRLMLKRPKLPYGFQGRGFKGSVRDGAAVCVISLCTILGWVGIKVKFQASSAFWFQPV